jgi:RNA polymerase sigma-70 factor (ECF subfamily)
VSDAELVARARLGDLAAFGELVDRHRTAVYRAARAALASHADAEDAAQDAFLAAYQRLDRFRGDASFKTWLLTIAWHEAINHRRRAGRWWRRLAAADPVRDREHADEGPMETAIASAFAVPAATPEDRAAHRQLARDAADAIRRLTPKLRDALLLAQSGEHSYEEIGSMLGVPVGTIKWRVSEARRRLRVDLAGRGHLRVAHE